MRRTAQNALAKVAPAPPGPRRFGRYELHEEIGSGGMAQVHLGWLAGDAGFGRVVAVKRLRAQLARDPEFVAMLLDEARIAARVRHPFVLAPIDAVADGDEVLLVLEHVHGETVAEVQRRLASGKAHVPVPVAVALLGNVLAALHAAHEAKDDAGRDMGLVHRDVSPQNVLLGADGVARLLDFGVAKALGRIHQTRAGHVKGKLGYMAPEQLVPGEPVTRLSDVYAASVLLWELLCARRMFDAETDQEVAAKVSAGAPCAPSALARGVPPALDAVVVRGLAMDPKKRFPTALAMADALSACPQASPGDVARWLAQVGGPELARRAERVVAIERRESVAGTRARDAQAFLARFPPTESGILPMAHLTTPTTSPARSDEPPPPKSGRVARLRASIADLAPRLTREPPERRLTPHDRGSIALAIALVVLGAGVLVATVLVLFGARHTTGSTKSASPPPAPAPLVAPPPTPAPTVAPSVPSAPGPAEVTIVRGPAPDTARAEAAEVPSRARPGARGPARRSPTRRAPRPL